MNDIAAINYEVEMLKQKLLNIIDVKVNLFDKEIIEVSDSLDQILNKYE